MAGHETDETIEQQSAEPVEPGLKPGDLRSVDRLLKALRTSSPDPFVMPRREAQREESGNSQGALQSWALQPLPSVPASGQRDGFLAWLFLSAGLMAFACGAAMLVWSVMEQREELWSFGVPLVLGGQGAIIFGLIGLAEAAGQRHKQVAAALEEHRQRLALMQNLALAGQLPPPSRRAA